MDKDENPIAQNKAGAPRGMKDHFLTFDYPNKKIHVGYIALSSQYST